MANINHKFLFGLYLLIASLLSMLVSCNSKSDTYTEQLETKVSELEISVDELEEAINTLKTELDSVELYGVDTYDIVHFLNGPNFIYEFDTYDLHPTDNPNIWFVDIYVINNLYNVDHILYYINLEYNYVYRFVG